MPNRLAHETSPYLRQHAENPVDWYPWGREALDRARDEDRPILLSVGYSTCHWCHVMAHESFEDAETARAMNEHFVCVKVDREELPDLDQIYQAALQVQGESGGWPLTMFLLPDGTPFYGGTYFPPRDQFGRPSFRRVLDALATTWRRDRAHVERNAGHFRDGLRQFASWGLGDGALGGDTVDRAAAKLELRIDKRLGGFEGAPKFPNPKALELLLRASRRSRRRGEKQAADETLRAVVVTLEHMARGGIYDQLGGGFARYSTDERWLVPHFEKMLYDNAQLLTLYAECYQLAPRPSFARVLRETAAWLERDLRDAHDGHEGEPGGLMTAMDADSEGLEGKYYVWTPTELRAELVDALGEEEGQRAAELYARCYGVVEGGNWRDPHGHGPVGASILHLVDEPHDAGEEALLARAAEVLLRARYRRVPPITDDKLLASSNGLAIAGLAEAGRVLGDAAMVDAARRTADFVLDRLLDERGGLHRSYKAGQAKFSGTLEDHAYVADGFIALYEACGEARYLEAAHRLTALCIERYWDEQQGAFYMTASGDPRDGADGTSTNEVPGLILRPLSRHDGAVPSGMSVCVENLVRLGDVSGESRWLQIAERALRTFHDQALSNPFGFANLLCALDLFQERPVEVVLAGPATSDGLRALRRAVAAVYLPNRVLVQAEGAPPLLAPLVAGKEVIEGEAAAWVCRDFACQQPTTAPERLREQLD